MRGGFCAGPESLLLLSCSFFLFLSSTAQLEPRGEVRQPTLPAKASHSVSATCAAATRLSHFLHGLIAGRHTGSQLHLLLLRCILAMVSQLDALLSLRLPLCLTTSPASSYPHRPMQHHQPHGARVYERSMAAPRRGNDDISTPRGSLQGVLDQVALSLPDGVRSEGRQAHSRPLQASEAQAFSRRAVPSLPALLLGVAVQLVLSRTTTECGCGAFSFPMRCD